MKYRPDSVQRLELKRMAGSVRTAENHEYYEKLLKAFVPDWRVDIKKAKFTGKGRSGSNLNTYRKVVIGNKPYFEKVYFNSRSDLQTVQWFQEHIYELIKDKINAPHIHKTCRGELLTIVYFDYLELAKLKKDTRERRLVQFSKDLYCISCENKSCLAKLEPPDSIKDFRNHSRYTRKVHFAVAKLIEQGMNMKLVEGAFEELITHSKHVLTHADINEGNGSKNAVLIDWDHFGLFPIGFDPALIYYRVHLRNKPVDNFTGWLEKHYKLIIAEEDWSDFERNFTYFLFVFAIKYFEGGQFKIIEQQLIEKLTKYSGVAV